MINKEYKYSELTEKIIGCAITVLQGVGTLHRYSITLIPLTTKANTTKKSI
jgi:hypothetical protein